jgi:hypothetical protein
MFAAHGLDLVVAAENHAGLLGGLGGAFLSLDIWVAADDAEEASALLHDLRERDDSSAVEAAAASARAAGDGESDAGAEADDEPSGSLPQRIDRRRRTGVALLLGCCITFGTAHVFTGAWARGILFAVIELIGIMRLAGGHTLGGVAVAAAIGADVIGAAWRIRTAPSSALPVARLLGA